MHEFLGHLEEYREMLMGRSRTLRYMWDWPAQLEIEDVVSATLTKAVEKSQSFRGTTRGEFGSWLLSILNSVVVDQLRHFFAAKRGNGRVRSFEDFLSESQSRLEKFLDAEMSSISGPLRRDELLQEVYKAIEQLPAQQREALLLHFVSETKIKDMSAILDCSERAVTERIYRGIANLKCVFGSAAPQGAKS